MTQPRTNNPHLRHLTLRGKPGLEHFAASSAVKRHNKPPKFKLGHYLLAHHTRKEAADRVLLPTLRLHDGGDRCPLGLTKQGEDGLLLCPAVGSNPRECSQAS